MVRQHLRDLGREPVRAAWGCRGLSGASRGRQEPGPAACASVVPSVSLSVLSGGDVPCVAIVPCSCS